MRIRAMTADDLDRALAIAAGLERAPQWPRSAYEAALDPTKPRRIALVAEDPAEGRIKGFVIALLAPPEAELETIAADARVQRQGIGRLLLDELAAAAGLAGVTEIQLEVRASNLPARALYHAQGFVEVGVRSGYYSDPKEDAVLMRLVMGDGGLRDNRR
jgi:ribosomal-protein-alanine N-acetyltransferase